MTDVVEQAKALIEPDARMDAYYYGFDHTGVQAIDRILSEVADAGKAYHSTECWTDVYPPEWARHGDTRCHQDRIQSVANEAAQLIKGLVEELELRRSLAK